MAEPSERNSTDSQRLGDSGALSAEASFSRLRRSQTLPAHVGTGSVGGRHFSKPRSAMGITPLNLDVPYPGTAGTAPDYTAVEKRYSEQDMPPRKALNPQRSSAWNPSPQDKAPNGRRVLIIWTISCFAFLVIAPLISVVVGARMHTRDFLYSPSQDITTLPGRRLEMWITLVSADPEESVATFDWEITGDFNGPCSDQDAKIFTNETCTDVNIFIDK